MTKNDDMGGTSTLSVRTEGKITTVSGPQGCGKTTWIRAAMNADVTAGMHSVLWDRQTDHPDKLEVFKSDRSIDYIYIEDCRPVNCRFRLMDEGKYYPKSACNSCGRTVFDGLGDKCPEGATTYNFETCPDANVTDGLTITVQPADGSPPLDLGQPVPAEEVAMSGGARFMEKDPVKKKKGYRWPGVVVSRFKNLDGDVRYVVQCVHPVVYGALHIFSDADLEWRDPEDLG